MIIKDLIAESFLLYFVVAENKKQKTINSLRRKTISVHYTGSL